MRNDRPLIGIQIEGKDPGLVVNGIEEGRSPAQAAQLIKDLNIEMTLVHFNWGNIEPEPGQRDWSSLEWWDGLKQELGRLPATAWTLYPIHMNERGPLPSDLKAVAFDDPIMLERFDAFITDVAVRAGWKDDPPIVIVGNEIDLFAGNHPDEVGPALAFLDGAADLVRKRAPGARVANTCTFDAIESAPGLLKDVNKNTDVVSLTWYDLGSEENFGGTGQSDMEAVIRKMEETANGKPVFIAEISLPSGAIVGSSEELQARRVAEMFEVLGRRTRSQVEGVIWLTINDWAAKEMVDWVKMQFPSLGEHEGFLSFLTTLGIRTFDAKPKAAWQVWTDRAKTWREG